MSIQKYLRSPAATIHAAYQNVHLNNDITMLNRRFKAEYGTSISYALRVKVPFLYLLIRKHKPELMVETGVEDGVSTYFILKAMQENGKGRLISIDLPFNKGEARSYDGHVDMSGVSKNRGPGWLVPEELAKGWKLILGDSKKVLPTLEAKGLDFFLHDSEHSYETQHFEYEWAYKHIAHGVIASDDVEWNDAWPDFLKEHGLPKVNYPYAYTSKSSSVK